ncbi:methyltransferase [Thermobifida alba]|uniref:Methyltransferase n=1 Tax=Thermobifida alba TaxID=53522 RepID=A0ABY4KZU5_THEAE|nr:methyltransferase [Thermobifida alba]UPT20953.1 methyltransferase [Thermobifida alba]HLU95405.1 methyltransferase [Thermobifida alba]
MDHPLVAQLPPPLPADRVVAINRPRGDLGSHRSYTWHGWTFDVPPGVFLPGATSRMIHQRVLDGDIDVRGRRYAAMGVGLGVEAVAAGLRGAREVYAVDVHADSVATAARHYARIVGDRPATRFVPVVADLFDGFPEGVRLDVVTFNPPAVSQPVSDDPDVVRNVCVGAALLETFFAQLADRDLLAPGAEVFVIVSNTADLRRILHAALDRGFTPHVHHRHDWGDGVVTLLFRLTREDA